jgi:hypothetical protein
VDSIEAQGAQLLYLPLTRRSSTLSSKPGRRLINCCARSRREPSPLPGWKIDVPGIDEKNIDVSVQNNTLTVHGERKIEKEEKEENFRRVERQYGEFTRSFTLPSSVDPEQVSAHYDKGVLKISLAKKAEAKPKQIKVNVGSEKTVEDKVHGKAA